MNLIICDIDGVLADCSHRLHYLKEKKYEAFYCLENMIEDEPIYKGIDLFHKICRDESCFDICLLTGRPERTRKLTEMWLMCQDVKFNKMYMRKDGDYRCSPAVKVELVEKIIKDRTKYDSRYSGYFIDDDPKNIKAVCEAFPKIIGITFGVKRMEEK